MIQQLRTKVEEKQEAAIQTAFRATLDKAVKKANRAISKLDKTFRSQLTVGEKRMLRLAELLRTVDPGAFHMDFWGEKVDTITSDFAQEYGLDRQVVNECGFAGCAMGWAAYSGIFKDESLEFTFDDDAPCNNTPTFKGVGEFSAPAAFFEISHDVALDIFTDNSDDGKETPTQVANRLEKFVRRQVSRRSSNR